MTELISPIGNGLLQMSLINGRIYLSKTIIKMRQLCCNKFGKGCRIITNM